MSALYPGSWSELRYPWIRAELIEYLREISVADPRPIWKAEAAQGLISGVDQLIHFLFDDHELDGSDIGLFLFDQTEVASMQKVKAALNPIIDALPYGGDDDYVSHALWPAVAEAAKAALLALAGR